MSSESVNILLCWGGSWEIVNGVYEYLPVGLPIRAISLPANVRHSKLKKLIAKKARLDVQQEFRLCYKMSTFKYPVDIFDDEDVGFLMEVVRNNPYGDLTLFVVHQMGLGSGSNQPHVLGPSTGYHPQQINDYQSQQINTFDLNTYPTPEINQYHTPQSSQYPIHNPFVYSHDHISQHVSNRQDFFQPLFGVENEKPQSTFERFGSNKEHVAYVDLNYNPLTDPDVAKELGISESSSSEREDDVKKGDDNEDEDDVDQEEKVGVPPQMQPNYFWSMPESLKCPTFQQTPAKPRSYVPSAKIYEGQFFNNKDELKVFLGIKCLEDGREFRVTQSSTRRFEAHCAKKGCEWFFRATKLQNDDSVFQVKTLKDHHTCSKTQTNPNHRNANKHVLGHILRDQLKDSSRVYRGSDIMIDLNQRFQIDVSYSQAWRGKCRAIELLRGTDEESFYKLPIYCHNLKKANPGTVTHIKTDNVGRFENLFVAIGVAVSKCLSLLYFFLSYLI